MDLVELKDLMRVRMKKVWIVKVSNGPGGVESSVYQAERRSYEISF